MIMKNTLLPVILFFLVACGGGSPRPVGPASPPGMCWYCFAAADCPDPYVCDLNHNRCHPLDCSAGTVGFAPGHEPIIKCPDGSGCAAGGGERIDRCAWACPGAFSKAAPASSLCAQGFAVYDGRQGQLDPAAGNRLAGVYLGNISGTLEKGDFDPNNATCEAAPTSSQGRLWYAVGTAMAGGGSFDSRPCKGLTRFVDCRISSAFTCNFAASLDQSSGLSAGNGVICAAPF